MTLAILRLCQTAKVTCCASTVRLPLATCNMRQLMRPRRQRQSCKVIWCVRLKLSAHALYKRSPESNRAKLVELAKLLAGGKGKKHKREVRCREEKEEGRKQMETGIVYALLDVSHYTRLPSKENLRDELRCVCSTLSLSHSFSLFLPPSPPFPPYTCL